MSQLFKEVGAALSDDPLLAQFLKVGVGDDRGAALCFTVSDGKG